MTTIERASAAVAATATDEAPQRRGILFWIVRYLPAEIAGTAAMVVAGLGVTIWTENAAIIAASALVGEIVGFYLVLGVTVAMEQSRLGSGRILRRTVLLLVAEFGVAELLDTIVIRPLALFAGILLLGDSVIGLLVGKIAADIVFYAIAAGAFTITVRTGLRRGKPSTGQTVP